MAYKIKNKKKIGVSGKELSYQKKLARQYIKNKLDFWEKRTGDIPTTNYISVREMAQDGYFKGKITHHRGSDQLIVKRNGKTIYDSNRSYEFYDTNSKKSAEDFIMRNLDFNKISFRPNPNQ